MSVRVRSARARASRDSTNLLMMKMYVGMPHRTLSLAVFTHTGVFQGEFRFNNVDEEEVEGEVFECTEVSSLLASRLPTLRTSSSHPFEPRCRSVNAAWHALTG